MKTFLIEKNQMQLATTETLKVMRYTLHRSIGMSPFQKYFGRPHSSEIDELLCLENPGNFFMEHVADLDGVEVWDNTLDEEEIGKIEDERQFGRSRPIKELKDFVNKQKNVSDKFYVHKNTKKKGFDSDYSTVPFKADSEAKHTVQAGKKTFHKKMLADVTKLVSLSRKDSADGRHNPAWSGYWHTRHQLSPEPKVGRGEAGS